MRPCLLAGDARGISTFCPLTTCFTDTASPRAYTSSAEVSMYWFTRISPLAPSSMALSFKNPVSGRTPMLMITMSASTLTPLSKIIPSLSMAVQVCPR
ncbi:MAG: hypothetical protein ENTB_02449 [Enterocloster aldenensis]